MSAYDKSKVEQFCQQFEGDDAGLFFFVAHVLGGNPVPVRTLHQVRDFGRLSPWERANVVYQIRDQIDGTLQRLAKTYVRIARDADDLEEQDHGRRSPPTAQ